MNDDIKAFPLMRGSPGQPGMTLRDWFAGQIAAAAMTNAEGLGTLDKETRRDTFDACAGIAYELSDALIRARSNTAR